MDSSIRPRGGSLAGVVTLGLGLPLFLLGCSETPQTSTLDPQATSRLEQYGQDLKEIRKELGLIASRLELETGEPLAAEPQPEFATIAKAEKLIGQLGDKPNAESLAIAIATIDGWMVEPAQEDRFVGYKMEQQNRLRELVKQEVQAQQEAALQAGSGSEAAQKHSEAGHVLSMYPMSNDSNVLDEARRLATRQAEIATRMEVIRRQRYNRWATERIEKTLDFYNANVSKWNPFNDNAVLIDDLVKNLGEVDPAVLEPAVLELYNYVIDRTKGSISEKNKLELAKRLTDSSISRKTLGEF